MISTKVFFLKIFSVVAGWFGWSKHFKGIVANKSRLEFIFIYIALKRIYFHPSLKIELTWKTLFLLPEGSFFELNYPARHNLWVSCLQHVFTCSFFGNHTPTACLNVISEKTCGSSQISDGLVETTILHVTITPPPTGMWKTSFKWEYHMSWSRPLFGNELPLWKHKKLIYSICARISSKLSPPLDSSCNSPSFEYLWSFVNQFWEYHVPCVLCKMCTV